MCRVQTVTPKIEERLNIFSVEEFHLALSFRENFYGRVQQNPLGLLGNLLVK